MELLETRALLSVTTGSDPTEADRSHGGGCGCPLCHMEGNLAVYAAIPPDAEPMIRPDVLPAVEAAGAGGGSGAAALAGNVPLSSLPALSSLPGAFAKIFLDFDGDVTPNWGTYRPQTTPAFNTDGDATTFSPSELSAIQEIWKRVAEKYSPFNVDVTTVDPGNINNLQTLKVVIGGNGSWFGPPSGGIAYVDSFSNPDSLVGANIVFVFSQNLGSGNPKYVAEAAAHEAAHAFGLEHQSVWNGATKTNEYNSGDSLRAPIMGTSYYAARGLWWYGRNSAVGGPTQDDMAVIASAVNGFGFRSDDHGNSVVTATALMQNALTVYGSGVIETSSDSDYFSFTTAPGTVRFTVSPASFGAMLDASLELRDATGTLIVAADTASLGESLTANLAAGSYRIIVKSHGNYGDVGQYTLVGSLPDAYENNDTRETAAHLGNAPGINLPNLNIDRAGDDDWYKFTLTGSNTIDVAAAFNNSSGNLDLQVTDAFGTVLAASNTTADGELVKLPNLTAGTYFVHVFGVGGATNDYSLSIVAGSLPLDLIAPRVTGVTLVGGGAAQTQYAMVVGDGEQLATVPIGFVKQIRITFSEAVNVDQNDLQLVGANVAAYGFSGFGYDSNTRTAIWLLTQPIDIDQVALRLNADGASPIADLAGNRLDGEWDNPTGRADPSSSVFPSGNGVAGGDFYFLFSVMPGDANRDNQIDIADYTIWADRYLQAGGWTSGDFNDDGLVDMADYTVWSDHFLAPPAPSLPVILPQPGAPAAAAAAIITSDFASSQVDTTAVGPLQPVESAPAFDDSIKVLAPASAALSNSPAAGVAPIRQVATTAPAISQTRIASVMSVEKWSTPFTARADQIQERFEIVDRWFADDARADSTESPLTNAERHLHSEEARAAGLQSRLSSRTNVSRLPRAFALAAIDTQAEPRDQVEWWSTIDAALDAHVSATTNGRRFRRGS